MSVTMSLSEENLEVNDAPEEEEVEVEAEAEELRLVEGGGEIGMENEEGIGERMDDYDSGVERYINIARAEDEGSTSLLPEKVQIGNSPVCRIERKLGKGGFGQVYVGRRNGASNSSQSSGTKRRGEPSLVMDQLLENVNRMATGICGTKRHGESSLVMDRLLETLNSMATGICMRDKTPIMKTVGPLMYDFNDYNDEIG